MDTLVLNYNVCPEERVQLTPVLRHNGREELGATYPRVCGAREAVQLSREIRQAMGEAVQVMFRPDGTLDVAAARGHLKTIRTQGERLRGLILPTPVVDSLRESAAIGNVVFRCDPLLNSVAFEALYVGDEFLAFRYGVGRQLLTADRPRYSSGRTTERTVLRGYCAIDPGSVLTAQGDHGLAAEWRHFAAQWHPASEDRNGNGKRIDFRDSRAFRDLTKEALADALRHHDLVNLLCHHRYDEQHPEQSGFELGPATVFTAQDLVDSLAEGAEPPRVVFSVACESGITRGWESSWPHGNRLYGMVDAAIRCGIRHYISTVVRVPVVRSPRLMLPFYQAIAAGRTVGVALRDARRALRDEAADGLDGGTAIGLGFVLYGDPDSAYCCAEGHVLDGAPAVSCEAVCADGQHCGKALCRQEAGFGQRLCNEHAVVRQNRCAADHWPTHPECLVASATSGSPTSCPHCGRYVGARNPWVGICADCSQQVCAHCGRWHEQTAYCPRTDRSSTERDAGWMQLMRLREQSDAELAVGSRLHTARALADSFQNGLRLNLAGVKRSCTGRPTLPGTCFGPWRRVELCAAELDRELAEAHIRGWDLPEDRSMPTQRWSPPDDWLIDCVATHQLRVHRLFGRRGRQALVAAIAMSPIRFEPGRGPVFVACDAGHLELARATVCQWWQRSGEREMPVTCLVVESSSAFAPSAVPAWDGRVLTVLVAPHGAGWHIGVPAGASELPQLGDLVARLTPVTDARRRQEIRQHVVDYLRSYDFTTVAKVEDAIELGTAQCATPAEIAGAFTELAATTKYICFSLPDGQQAIRLATRGERTAQGHPVRARILTRLAAAAGIVFGRGLSK